MAAGDHAAVNYTERLCDVHPGAAHIHVILVGNGLRHRDKWRLVVEIRRPGPAGPGKQQRGNGDDRSHREPPVHYPCPVAGK